MIDVVPLIVDNNCTVIDVIGTGFFTGPLEGEGPYIEDWFFYIDNSMYFGDDEDWGSAINATGYITNQFVAAGFRPGRHEVHVIADGEGSIPWTVWAKDCFWVSTVGDPIVEILDALNLTMADLEATIIAVDGTIATLETTIGELQVDIADLSASITAIEGNVATIKTDCGTIKTSLTSLSASISSVSSGMATLQTSIGTVQTSLTSIDAVIGSMYGDVVEISTTIGSFETSLDSIDATVSAMDAVVGAVAGDVVEIQTSLGTIEGKITSIEGTLATIETDLGTVQVDLAGAKTDIAAVEADVNDNLPVDMMPVWIAVVLALIAAIGSIAGVFIIQRKIA